MSNPSEQNRIPVTVPSKVFDALCDLAETTGVSVETMASQIASEAIVKFFKTNESVKKLAANKKELDDAVNRVKEIFGGDTAEAATSPED